MVKITTLSKKQTLIYQASVFFIVLAFICVGIFKRISTENAIITLAVASVVGLALFTRETSLSKGSILLVTLASAIFIFTFYFSPFVGRSLVQAYFIFCSALLYTILCGYKNQKSKHFPNGLQPIKAAFLLMSIIHSLSLIILYLINPIRTTGLMEDYSQASLIILFAFGIAYPSLKNKHYFITICLVLFVGFFTTYSRTSNMLLVILLIALAIYEYQLGKLRSLLKPLIIIFLAFSFVHIYPVLIKEPSVDRGGFRDLATLNSRTIYWSAAIEAIKEKPLAGHGMGNFEWTGIKESRPFRIIHHVHNDYLQVWHDLGFIWLATLSFLYLRMLYLFRPFQLFISRKRLIQISSNEQHYVSWVLLASLALYMLINFAIYSIALQVGLVILALELQKKEDE